MHIALEILQWYSHNLGLDLSPDYLRTNVESNVCLNLL